MGKGYDGSTAAGQPQLPVKVKNTFIDIDERLIDDRLLDECMDEGAIIFGQVARQVSEPAPAIFRQLSGAPSPQHILDALASNKAGLSNWLGKATLAEMPNEQEFEESDSAEDSGECSRLQAFMSKEEPDAFESEGWGRLTTADPWSAQPGDGLPWSLGPAPAAPEHTETVCPGADPQFEAEAFMGHMPREAPTMLTAGMRGVGGVPMPPPDWGSTLTVMIRNLPNKYTQDLLMGEIVACGFQGTFDFMYLPMDLETGANRGYAFINFVSPETAWMFKLTFEGRKMNYFNSSKLVSVMPASLQGFEANHRHFVATRVSHGDPGSRPLFLRQPAEPLPAKPAASRGRRRRGGGSLIDQAAREAKQRAAVAVVAQQQAFGVVPKAVTGVFIGDAAGLAPDTGAKKFCPYCGGKAEACFRFCQFCGASLGQNPSVV